MKELTKVAKEIMAKRVEDICNDLAHSEWYRDIQNEIIMVRRQLINTESKNSRDLLELYDSLCLKLHCKTADELYLNAYIDGRGSEI